MGKNFFGLESLPTGIWARAYQYFSRDGTTPINSKPEDLELKPILDQKGRPFKCRKEPNGCLLIDSGDGQPFVKKTLHRAEFTHFETIE